MRLRTICVGIVTCIGCVKAQPTFQNLYRSGTSYGLDMIELPGKNILTAMGATLLLDPEGQVDHAGFFHGGGTYLVQNMKAVAANEIAFTTGMSAGPCPWDDRTLTHPVLGKMDSLGRVTAMRRFELNADICGGLLGGLEVTADDGVIAWGREDSNSFALKVNADLEPIWARKVPEIRSFRFIKELPGGDLLAGIEMSSSGVVIARMNANGEFLWAKNYMHPAGEVHDALIISDGSYVILGYTGATTQELFLMNTDGSGAVQWCRGYAIPSNTSHVHQRSRVLKTLANDYVILGGVQRPAPNSAFAPFLMRTDANGDTLWTRSIGAESFSFINGSMALTSDGGILVSGLITGDLPEMQSDMLYIFKATAQGRSTCQERNYPLQVLDLFPTDNDLTLIGIAATPLSTLLVVNDSIADPELVRTYDACVVTSATGHFRQSPERPTVRPNPNAGRFTVEFADPLLAESYYSVYDAVGKLLVQRKLPTGATVQEVDLSGHGKGAYVIKFTGPGGVCHERVVVE